jgi:hypothetical protein
MGVYQYPYRDTSKISTEVMPISTKKRIKSTIIVDADVWKEVRIEAIRRDMEIGQFVEEALIEKLAADKATDLRIRNRVREISKGLGSLEKKLLGGEEEEDPEYDKPLISTRQQPQLQQANKGLDKRIEDIHIDPAAVRSSIESVKRVIEKGIKEPPLAQSQEQEAENIYRREVAQELREFTHALNDKKGGWSKEKTIYLLERFPARGRINLPGIKFPINKNEIVQYAEKANTEKIVNIIKDLPDQTYNDTTEIEKSLVKITMRKKYPVKRIDKKTGEFLIVNRRIGKIIVDIRDIRDDKQQLQKQVQKQEQELGELSNLSNTTKLD